jgi:hypothetical protein
MCSFIGGTSGGGGGSGLERNELDLAGLEGWKFAMISDLCLEDSIVRSDVDKRTQKGRKKATAGRGEG